MADLHPLWRPFGTVTPEELRRAQVGERERLPAGRVEVAPPRPGMAAVVRRGGTPGCAGRSGTGCWSSSTSGSTSVPELHAKPVIDVDRTVADSADEPSYLPELEAAGVHAAGA
jgi:hypothetical protein